MSGMLYYDAPFQKSFSSTVHSVVADTVGASPITRIELEETCFYPAGGGQPGDRGYFECGDQRYRVHDTVKGTEGRPQHLVEGAPAIDRGTPCHGELDWSHRYDYMQQHSGQHLLSAALQRVTGANTVGVHQGERYTSIEVDRRDIPESELQEVISVSQGVISESRALRSFVVDSSELGHFRLRRPTDRTGAIRLVEIEDWDLVACAGVHLDSTARIGNVQVVSTETIRGNMRIHFAIGDRAHRDYREARSAAGAAATLFSSGIGDVPERVDQALNEIKALHGQAKSFARRIAELTVQRQLAAANRAFIVDVSDDGEAVFDAATRYLAEQDTVACVIHRGETKTRWAIVVAGDTEVSATVKGVISEAGARGGGRSPVWQGVTNDPEKLANRFLAAFATT